MKENQRKRVFVCSPYRGKTPLEIKENIIFAQKAVERLIKHGYAPYAPHLYLTDILDDNNENERETGIKIGFSFLETCEMVIVFNYKGITEGMEREIMHAHKYGIPVYVAREDFKEQ